MYKFLYRDEQVKSMFSDRKAFWDAELEQELSPILETLKKYGEVAGASCGRKPGVTGLVYEFKGQTFQLTYTIDVKNKNIIFYEFSQVSHPIAWQAALDQAFHSDEEQPIYIPQIGDPHKFIKTVELIYQGINTSKDLGIAFGSGAKKAKDLARRGEYLGRSIIEMGLARRYQLGKQSASIYVLTEQGQRIAQSNDQETRERLLAEALLGFHPIQMIIDETTRGDKELTKELIQEIISLVTWGDCGGTTNPRRASSLRALVNWVTRWAGIPIRRKGNDGVQLYIPYIYAN